MQFTQGVINLQEALRKSGLVDLVSGSHLVKHDLCETCTGAQLCLEIILKFSVPFRGLPRHSADTSPYVKLNPTEHAAS